AGPRLGGGAEVLALLLLEQGELLLEGDLRVDVALGGRLLLEEVREIVPALLLLEQARERGARALVGAIDREQLLPRADRAVDVAQVALAEPRDLAQALLARLHGLVLRGLEAHGREEHVAELAVVALRAQVLLDPYERLGVRGIGLEHLLV